MLTEQISRAQLKVVKSLNKQTNKKVIVMEPYDCINTLVPSFSFKNKRKEEIVYKGKGLPW